MSLRRRDGRSRRDRNEDARPSIDLYVKELSSQLRFHGLRRWRIVREVRDHLSESASDFERKQRAGRGSAEHDAIARFGGARQIAAELNARPPAHSRAAHRLALLWVSWIAAMGMGSATVWAAVEWPTTAGARSTPGAVDARQAGSKASHARARSSRSGAKSAKARSGVREKGATVARKGTKAAGTGAKAARTASSCARGARGNDHYSVAATRPRRCT
jgi:hypothetical protein